MKALRQFLGALVRVVGVALALAAIAVTLGILGSISARVFWWFTFSK